MFNAYDNFMSDKNTFFLLILSYLFIFFLSF